MSIDCEPASLIELALEIALKDAERVMSEIDALVRNRGLDSRSGVADARLDYCEPGTSRLEQIQREYRGVEEGGGE